MNKHDFLTELESLLIHISSEDREEAMQYYNDYFVDAGIENEEQVIQSLGSPRQVADTILSGLEDTDGNTGEFSESGFHGAYETPLQEVIPVKKSRGINTAWIILLIIAGVFISPFLGSIGSGLIGIIFTILAITLCIIFGTAALGIGMIVTGTIMFMTGIGTMISSLYGGVCIVGAGFFMLGLGIILTMLGVKIITVVVPWIIQKVVKVGRFPFFKNETN